MTKSFKREWLRRVKRGLLNCVEEWCYEEWPIPDKYDKDLQKHGNLMLKAFRSAVRNVKV